MSLVQGVNWGNVHDFKLLSMVNKATVPVVAITAPCTFKVGQ